MTYPEAKFCSAEHGYFDRNKHIKCPQCTEENAREHVKEETKGLQAKNKMLRRSVALLNKVGTKLQSENKKLKDSLIAIVENEKTLTRNMLEVLSIPNEPKSSAEEKLEKHGSKSQQIAEQALKGKPNDD